MSYNIGFIGCGGRGRVHARAYKEIDKVIFAAADIDANRLQSFQDEFKIQNGYNTFKEMFDNEALDIVHLATQPTLRIEAIVMAAEHGAQASNTSQSETYFIFRTVILTGFTQFESL